MSDAGPAGDKLVVRNQTRNTVLGDRVDLAARAVARLIGLLGRPGLYEGEGLWIDGTNSIHMMGMRFPIDVVFLGPEQDGISEVLDLRQDLPPWTGVVWWSKGAKVALELPAGTIGRTRTGIGDLVSRGI